MPRSDKPVRSYTKQSTLLRPCPKCRHGRLRVIRHYVTGQFRLRRRLRCIAPSCRYEVTVEEVPVVPRRSPRKKLDIGK